MLNYIYGIMKKSIHGHMPNCAHLSLPFLPEFSVDFLLAPFPHIAITLTNSGFHITGSNFSENTMIISLFLIVISEIFLYRQLYSAVMDPHFSFHMDQVCNQHLHSHQRRSLVTT